MSASFSIAPSPADFPGQIQLRAGHGGLPLVEITTPQSTAQLYLHGAQVTHFQKRNEPPLLFLSQQSHFQTGKPIRGGIPVIFPWFGLREGMGQHGFVRNRAWQLEEVAVQPNGSVTLRLRFPDGPERVAYPPFLAELVVRVNERLTLELRVTNQSKVASFEFENCLHTYFWVEDIVAVSLHGLQGVRYLDKTAESVCRTEVDDLIRFSAEVDRAYLDTTATVEIRDARIGRMIRVEKENSASTVVWNPWIAKAHQMADFGGEEYRNMLCVESGNVASNKLVLPPGKTAALKVSLSTLPLS